MDCNPCAWGNYREDGLRIAGSLEEQWKLPASLHDEGRRARNGGNMTESATRTPPDLQTACPSAGKRRKRKKLQLK
jgi:hypothetical protein